MNKLITPEQMAEKTRELLNACTEDLSPAERVEVVQVFAHWMGNFPFLFKGMR
jgi:hypothetical protein